MTRYPELVERLRASSERFLAAAEGVGEAQAVARPASSGWTILECVEHVVSAEGVLFHGIALNQTPRADAPARNLEAAIIARGLDRARKFEAPESVRPNSRFRTIAEALAAFREIRAHSVAWVESCGQDLRRCPATHPLFGQITGYEMILFIAMHAMRHALQIRELRG